MKSHCVKLPILSDIYKKLGEKNFAWIQVVNTQQRSVRSEC